MSRSSQEYLNPIAEAPLCSLSGQRELECGVTLPPELQLRGGIIVPSDEKYLKLLGIAPDEILNLIKHNLIISNPGFDQFSYPSKYAQIPWEFGRCLTFGDYHYPEWQAVHGGKIVRTLSNKGPLPTGFKHINSENADLMIGSDSKTGDPVGFHGAEDAILDYIRTINLLKAFPELADYFSLPVAIVPLNRSVLEKVFLQIPNRDTSRFLLNNLAKCTQQPALFYRFLLGKHRYNTDAALSWPAIVHELRSTFPDSKEDPRTLLKLRFADFYRLQAKAVNAGFVTNFDRKDLSLPVAAQDLEETFSAEQLAKSDWGRLFQTAMQTIDDAHGRFSEEKDEKPELVEIPESQKFCFLGEGKSPVRKMARLKISSELISKAEKELAEQNKRVFRSDFYPVAMRALGIELTTHDFFQGSSSRDIVFSRVIISNSRQIPMSDRYQAYALGCEEMSNKKRFLHEQVLVEMCRRGHILFFEVNADAGDDYSYQLTTSSEGDWKKIWMAYDKSQYALVKSAMPSEPKV